MRYRLLLAATASLVLAGVAPGQGIVIDEPRTPPTPVPPPAREFRAVFIKDHVVEARIEQGVAQTTIDQVFHNPNDAILEGTYVFPLPETAAIGKFSMFMDGKEIAGEVLDADQARGIYESIVRTRRDPGLLEYVGRKMIRARVFPIPAQGDVRIKISYAQELETEGSLTAYEYPLNSSRFSKEPLASVRVSLTLASEIPLKSIYSPTHPVEIVRKGDHEATVHYEGEKVVPDADFRLYYQVSKKDLGVALLTHRAAGEDGYFLVMISPKEEYAPEEIQPKDLTLVVDTSGSMLGPRMDQAKAALVYCLEHLDRRDRFQIVRFSTEVDAYAEGLSDASEENVQKAKAWVGMLEARGGTNIIGGLQKALEIQPTSGRVPMIVFITDGKPTIGERGTGRIVEGVRTKNPSGSRIFVFGVGEDLNAQLLDLIAEENHGTRSYVGEKDDLQVRLASFYEKVSSPVLSDLALDFGGMKVKDLYPKKLPDLFQGMQLVLFGRYAGEGDHALKLTGQVGGQPREYVYEGTFPASKAEGDFLPRLWARRKVGYLLDQIRLHGESQELKDEIVALGKKHGIVTPYTSFLVLEDGMTADEWTAGQGGPGPAGRPAPAPAIERLERRLEEARKSNGDSPAEAPSAPDAAPEPSKNGEGDLRGFFDGLGGGASGESSGSRAIEQSKQLDEMKDADDLSTQEAKEKKAGLDAIIRRVEQKTFYWREGVWTDADFDAKAGTPETKVVFLSDAYFALLKEKPDLGQYLSLGQSVVVVHEGRVYRIVPEEKPGEK